MVVNETGLSRASGRLWSAVTVLATWLVVAAALAGCGSKTSQAATPSLPKPTATAPSRPRPAATTQRPPILDKVCVDPTSSSPISFASGVLQAVAEAVSNRVPAPPATQPTRKMPPVRPLQLWVRQVGTHSFATDQPVLDLTISGVPALPAPPGITDPNLVNDELRWAEKHEQPWMRDLRAARAQQQAAVEAIRRYPLHTLHSMSAISGCLAALADSGPQSRSVRMILASDLVENEPPATADYAGAAILIVQSCPGGSEQQCAARAASWTARLRKQGAGSVSVVRADAATGCIQQWIQGVNP